MNSNPSILSFPVWPGALTVLYTAQAIGVQPSDIPVLTAAKILKPLGNPGQNGQKLYSSVEVRRLIEDPDRLSRALRAIQEYHRRRNRKYAASRTDGGPN